MLWPGKTFGAAQVLGITRQYHATLRTKKACHFLELSRKSLAHIAQGGAERQWLVGWQQRAKASLDSDLKLMKRKVREHRRMLRVGLNLFGESNKVFLAGVIAAWHRAAATGDSSANARRSRSSMLPGGVLAREVTRPIDIEAKDY